MPGPASPTHRPIRKPGSEFTNQLTAATHGYISPPIRVCLLVQALTALAPLGMGACGQRLPIAVRLSTGGPSLRSLSIQTIRIPFTLALFALHAASALS